MPTTTIIHLDRNTEGAVVNTREVKLNTEQFEADLGAHEPFKRLTETTVNGRKMHLPLKEAFLTNPDAANILRSDIRYIAFSTYEQMPRSFDGFTKFEASNKPKEAWIKDSTIGALPRVPSGTLAPTISGAFKEGTEIVNNRYAALVEVLGDWLRFDQLGKIRQVSAELGRAARITEESQVYTYLTATGNYTRNSTTSDNDIGANTATATLNAATLETALATIGTAKDAKSGAYLGYNADTFICGPRNMWYAKMLLQSPMLVRASANNAAETRGLGENNPYLGSINRIVVSPWFGASYQWAICDSTAGGFIYQTVEPFNVFQEEANMSSEAWLTKEVTRWLVQGYFGLGFLDDRAWYYSDSTTLPTVA